MSNQNPKLALEFELKDIPWLFHALSIGRNTAMMCSGPKVKDRIVTYIDKLKEFSPTLANYDIEEYAFYNACTALTTCKTWTVYQENPRYKWELKHGWWKPVVFQTDKGSCELIRRGYHPQAVLALIDIFKQMSPDTAEYQEHPSIHHELLPSRFDD